MQQERSQHMEDRTPNKYQLPADATDFEIRFGKKHNGEMASDVYRSDPSYILWAVKQTWLYEDQRRLLDKMIEANPPRWTRGRTTDFDNRPYRGSGTDSAQLR